MTFEVQDVVERLADAGVRLDRGLTEADLKRIEKKFGFEFGPDHRALLRAALPLGDAWLNWRHATPTKIRERLQAPIDGVIFDVRSNGFWPGSWGERPADEGAAEHLARGRLAAAPVLVPLYGHRYFPAAPTPTGSPVFSVHQSDVIIFADDLLSYADVEFGTGRQRTDASPSADRAGRPHVAFWSDLAQSGVDPAGGVE